MTTYCYKFYNAAKDGWLDNMLDRYGIVRNHVVALFKRYYRLYGKHPSKYMVMSHVAALRRRSARWGRLMDGLDAQAIQDVTERVDRTYAVFFKWKRRKLHDGKKHGLPKFRKVKKHRSFTLKQTGYKIDWERGRIRICGRWFGFFNSERKAEGKVKTVTVKRDSVGDMFVYVVTEAIRSETLPQTGKSVGYDFGMKHFLTDDAGRTVDAPLFMQRCKKERRRLYRAMSRKKEGSRRWLQCKRAVARFNRKVARQRGDFQWKLARRILSENDVVCLEDLNLVGMARFRFGKKVGDYGFGEFVSKLEYLAAVTGRRVVKVGRYFPSSQTCSVCGHRNAAVKDLKVREWTCPKCGAHHDRDVNAAKNILKEGTSSFGGGSSKTIGLRKENVA